MLPIATSNLSALDNAAWIGLPVACVPVGSEFAPLTGGSRLLVASDGLYLEACSTSLYARLMLAPVGTPWGTSSPTLTLTHGPIPSAFYAELVERSLDAHPNEMAALIDVDEHGAYRLLSPQQHVGPASVSYADTDYRDGAIVIDAHSHGVYPANFSVTDDDSDRSRLDPHISLVFGQCEAREGIHVSGRLCIGHYLVKLDHATINGLFA